jgi:hypothetical protein
MKRLGLPIVAALSLASCIDQPTTNTTQDDVTTLATTNLQSKGPSYIVPVAWNPTQYNQVSDYWSGDGTRAQAKVMLTFETGALPDANGNPTASYYWLVAGAADGSNSVFRVYTVSRVLRPTFQSTVRANLNLHEAEPESLTGTWDGGAGNGLGGTPTNPIGGPRGFPIEDENAVLLASQAFRSYYFNFAQTSAQY